MALARGDRTLTSHHMTTCIICTANNYMFLSSKYMKHISMYIHVSLLLGCYSTGTVGLSLEDCVVDSAIVTLTYYCRSQMETANFLLKVKSLQWT